LGRRRPKPTSGWVGPPPSCACDVSRPEVGDPRGVEPTRLHVKTVPDNPERGRKAQGRIGPSTRRSVNGPERIGGPDRRRERSLEVERHHSPDPSFALLGTLASVSLRPRAKGRVTPTKINRGGRGGANGTWARNGGNAGSTRHAGSTLRRCKRVSTNPMSAADRVRDKDPPDRPGCECPSSVG
jgi:hypothetical protein